MKILIVDDEKVLRESLSAALVATLKEEKLEITEAETGKQALDMVLNESYDLVLMDVRMPEMDGLTALQKIKEAEPRTFVVIMTAHSNLNDAVEAIKHGAYDYLEKPVNLDKLCAIINKSLEARSMISQLAISNPIFDDDIDSEFVGESEKMREIFSLIYKLCKVDTTVLIRGENGTGKELVARAIHFNSHRKDNSFVAINCGAIPENLIESELFGHEKGSFTGATERKIGKFQLANNGTIFLDEIAELRPDLQVKLLRVLQDKTFVPVGSSREIKTTARVIAATNQNLEKMIEEGRFREDLFYRLNVMPIFLPPLRDRKEDIPGLVDYFMKRFEKEHSRHFRAIEPDALLLLQNYSWPGNIRELENSIERAFIVEGSDVITKSAFAENIQAAGTKPMGSSNSSSTASPLNYEIFKEEMEKEFIIKALKQNKGRINKTVAFANIPKNTFLRKIKKYGINVKDYS